MRIRLLKILPLVWLCACPARVALAAGTGDPSYQDVLAAAEPQGLLVDWRVRVLSVTKHFYTYTLAARIVPDPGGSCDRCGLTVIFRGRPQDNARPGVYHPGQILAIRGLVLRDKPRIEILAQSAVPRGRFRSGWPARPASVRARLDSAGP